MKTYKKYFLSTIAFVMFAPILQAQYGYGNRYGRQRDALPQIEQSAEKSEPLTAEQIVDAEMPSIAEHLNLTEFEKAVVGTTLTKYVKQRMELQLLKLSPEKTKEGMEKILEKQNEELKAGLPEDKYNAFLDLQDDGFKPKKKKKRKKSKT